MTKFEYKYLNSSFSESYWRSIKLNKTKTFVRVIDQTGVEICKTYYQFHCDVLSCVSKIDNLPSDIKCVVTVSENRYENLVHIVAALLSGRSVCPLSSLQPDNRLLNQIKKIDFKVGVYSDRYDKMNNVSVGDLTWKDLGKGSPLKELKGQAKRDLADGVMFYIFTSGSTGESKIVPQSEQAVMANVDCLIDLHSLHEGKKLATCLPVYHVNALGFAFLGCLLSGSELTLFQSFDLKQVVENIEKHNIQILSLVPSLARALLLRKNSIKGFLQNLEYVVTAASYLPPKMAQEFILAFPFKLVQGYGLSEAVNFSTSLSPSLKKEELNYWLTNYQTPSIGSPLNCNQVEILTENGEIVTTEEAVGELAIKGINVMAGYLKSDGSEFVGDYLLTGDLGYFVFCGKTGHKYFFIIGRRKDIIKRNGETVSLKEVDDEIQQLLPEEILLISVGFSHSIYGEEVGGVYYLRNQTADISHLTSEIEKILPFHLRPKVLIRVDEIPFVASGKPQRRRYEKLFEKYQAAVFSNGSILIDKQGAVSVG